MEAGGGLKDIRLFNCFYVNFAQFKGS